MKSQGDLEQEQRRSYSFLCSVKRKKETHQEARLWSTGSLTLADKKELMWGWFRCSYKSIKLGTTRGAIQKKPESQILLLAVKKGGIFTSSNLFLIFFYVFLKKAAIKNIKSEFSHRAEVGFPNSPHLPLTLVFLTPVSGFHSSTNLKPCILADMSPRSHQTQQYSEGQVLLSEK